MSVPLTFVIFDLLRHKGVDLTTRPYKERRRKLERLKLDGPTWTTSETFDDGSRQRRLLIFVPKGAYSRGRTRAFALGDEECGNRSSRLDRESPKWD